MAATGVIGQRRPLRADPLGTALVVVLLVLAVVAWAATDANTAAMGMGGHVELGALPFFAGVWVTMMAAMMFPSVAPTVRTYALVERSRRARRGTGGAAAAIAAFVAGYLLTWTTFGLAAYAVVALLSATPVGDLSWDGGGNYLAGALILLAAAYELTPGKNACLTRCRGPLDFLMERWRDGVGGAVALGAEHGAWCVGCCWGLMAALFALGVMSLGWMAAIAVLIAAEKLVPWRRLAQRGVTATLALLGVAAIVAPGALPGL